MGRCRGNSILLFLAAWLLVALTDANAEWGYGVSGNLGSGLGYSREKQGDVTIWNFARTDNYTLGLNGRVLDPRLATFNIGGALSTADNRSNQKSGAEDSRLLSLIGNLSLLPAKPYPLDLRFSESHLTGGSDTDVLSFGGNWRIVYGDWPSLFLNFDRVNIESTGQARADTTFTTGTMRLAKRLLSSDLDAELGLQNFADDVRGASSFRHFGRLGSTTNYSAATTFRLSGDYFSQEENRSIGSTFSLINRPDPTLSRSLTLGIRNLTGKDQEQTTLDGNGTVSKAFQPFSTLSITPFITTVASQRFAAGGQGESTLINWSLGSSVISRYFASVLASGGYGLGLAYNNSEAEAQTNLGTTQQFNLGLQSALLQPYSLRGDYALVLERTLTDRNRHLFSLRANGPIIPTLFFRSSAEFFKEDATFTSQGATITAKQTNFNLGGGLTYTGIEQLYFDVGANASRIETDVSSSWITRLTANLNYRPRDRLTLMLNGTRESDTLNAQTRYEMIARALYQFGQTTVNLEYRFESRSILGQQGQGQSVRVSINRPFRFSF